MRAQEKYTGGNIIMTNKSVARLRLLDEAYKELKELDPNTNISKNFVRKLAISGEIATVQVGRKRLINLDSLFIYLNGSNDKTEVEENSLNKIRKVI